MEFEELFVEKPTKMIQPVQSVHGQSARFNDVDNDATMWRDDDT